MKFVLKLWLIPFVLIILILINFLNLSSENITSILPPVIIFALYLIYQKLYLSKRMERLYKKSDLETVLNFYDKKIKVGMMPEGKFIKSYTKSLAMSLYGEFERAKSEMDQYDMTYKAPLLHAMELNATVVNNYLQRKELKYSLELAKKAKDISRLPKAVPGSTTAENAYAAYIEIGEILNGNITHDIINRLENRFVKMKFLVKIQIAWALAIAYSQTNEPEKQKEMESYLKENVPNCHALTN